MTASKGFQPTYEELKLPGEIVWDNNPHYVFSLPMRNWNTSSSVRSSLRAPVFSLPMRNWNTLASKCSFLKNFLSFQPTYEELKQALQSASRPGSAKVFSLPMRNWNYFSFSWLVCPIWVFSLPMRNWNSGHERTFLDKKFVFSLPMRNWNTEDFEASSIRLEFSAYLWGIETPSGAMKILFSGSFSAYLWGIETLDFWYVLTRL